jgi:hypothetical protein
MYEYTQVGTLFVGIKRGSYEKKHLFTGTFSVIDCNATSGMSNVHWAA